jgi:hypothetical protein
MFRSSRPVGRAHRARVTHERAGVDPGALDAGALSLMDSVDFPALQEHDETWRGAEHCAVTA